MYPTTLRTAPVSRSSSLPFINPRPVQRSPDPTCIDTQGHYSRAFSNRYPSTLTSHPYRDEGVHQGHQAVGIFVFSSSQVAVLLWIDTQAWSYHYTVFDVLDVLSWY
jgi:hypothetical protein